MATAEQIVLMAVALLIGFLGNRLLNWFSGKRDVRCDVHDCQAEKITRFEDGLKIILEKIGDIQKSFDGDDGVWVRMRMMEKQLAVMGMQITQILDASKK